MTTQLTSAVLLGVGLLVYAAYTIRTDGLFGFGFFFLLLVGTAIYDAYAGIVLLLRLPRLRFDRVHPRWGTALRYGFLIVLGINWAWLIYRRV